MRNPAVSWRIILLAVLVGVFLVGGAACVTGTETGDSLVNWVYSWEAASERAQNENKPVMISFYTDLCPTCEALDSHTYTDATLAAFLNENVVPLKINAGRSALSNRYRIDKVPTIVFASPDGTAIGGFVGYRDPAEFQQETEAVLSQWEG